MNVPDDDGVEGPEPETLCEGLEELPCDGVIVLVSPVVTDCVGVVLRVAENDGVCDCVKLLLVLELAVGETEGVHAALLDCVADDDDACVGEELSVPVRVAAALAEVDNDSVLSCDGVTDRERPLLSAADGVPLADSDASRAGVMA